MDRDNLKVLRVAQHRNNGNWEITYIDDNELSVYKSLSQDLIHKKINKCKYITRIERIQLYNKFVSITVTYDNNNRSIYTVKEF